MKNLNLFITFFVTIFFSGCLTYRTVEHIIEFTDDSSFGTISVIYTDIQSSQKDEEKRLDDFRELIKLYKDDQFLLDQLEEGIYIRGRRLYQKDGIIYGQYSGIFREIKIDDSQLLLRNGERILLLQSSSDEQIETNGEILRSENNVLISWPGDQKKLIIKKTIPNEEKASYPLIDYYRNWIQ